ncbi:hypothetical protein [Hydrogenimonas sp.]
MEQIKLNKIEKLKRALRPYDYHEKLKALDAAKLDEADRFYLKNFGIYNHKLAPDTFTLRVRVPGGRLGAKQLAHLYEEARAHDASLLVTSRAQLELHGLTLPQAVAIHEGLESAGLTSWQTFTDNFRNLVTHPLDGIGEDALVECQPLLLRMQALFLKKPDFVGEIPRKFNTALVGNRTQLFSPFANDLAFVVAQKEGALGFNLYAGGKNTETAAPLDLFVRPEEAVAMFHAVATLYRDEGPRQSRSRARLFHMMEAMGREAFRRAVLARYEGPVRSAGELLAERGEAKRLFALKGGRVAVRYTTRFGELDDAMAKEVLEACERHGVEEVRLGCDQNLYLPGLPEKTAFVHEAARYGGIVACAGSKYCVYSLMDTKAESAALALDACERLGVSLGFSGCLKGCARHAFSDIGLVGIRTKLFADEVERGVRLYLGAEHTRGERVGRLILYSVPMRHLGAMLKLLTELFEASGYGDFETFAKEVLNRYSEPALAFWLLYNFHKKYVRKAEGLLLPAPRVPEDEKGCFLGLLEASDDPADADVAEYLRCQEAFPFREAIIFLERACFSVKSPS